MANIALAALDWASAAACSNCTLIGATWLSLLACWASDHRWHKKNL